MNIVFYSGNVVNTKTFKLENKHLTIVNLDLVITIDVYFRNSLIASLPANSSLELYDVIPQGKANRDIAINLVGTGASFQIYNHGKDN